MVTEDHEDFMYIIHKLEIAYDEFAGKKQRAAGNKGKQPPNFPSRTPTRR